MAKRLLEQIDQFNDTSHIECPRCHRHNIVSRGENRYVCLNCRWERDIDYGWGEGPPPFFVLLALITVIVIITLG